MQNARIIIIIFLLSYIQINGKNVISAYNSFQGYYKLPLKADKISFSYDLLIDQTKVFSFVPSVYGKNSQSLPEILSIDANPFIPLEKTDLNVTKTELKVTFPGIKPAYLSVLSLSNLESEKYKNFFFGLGLNFKDKRYSLVHSFYKQGIINKLSFSLVTPSDYFQREGKIIFGKLPKNYTNKKTHSKCFCDSHYEGWNCKLNNATINNSIYSQGIRDVLFTSAFPEIYVPEDFFQFIERSVLKEFIESKICFIIENFTYPFYRCLISILINKEKINFGIGDDILSVDFTDMFICTEFSCDLLIKNHRKDFFIFGNAFMDSFDITFDYDEKAVNFYSGNGRIKTLRKEPRGGNLVSILILNIFIMLISTIYLIKLKVKVI